jgi:hypothetical protein
MLEPSIEELLLSGVIEVSSIDKDTGEFLYSFTSKLTELMPDLWNDKMQEINKELMFFWENGFIDVQDNDTDNPLISLTELALDLEAIAQLPEDKQEILAKLKKFFEK